MGPYIGFTKEDYWEITDVVLNAHKRTQIKLKHLLKPKNTSASLPEVYSIESAPERHDVLINVFARMLDLVANNGLLSGLSLMCFRFQSEDS